VVVRWDGKDYYPKLTPKTFGCAKVPSAAAVELRRCAHRPRELSLQTRGRADSRVRRAHPLITLPIVWRRIHIFHLHEYCYIFPSAVVSCSPSHGRPNWKQRDGMCHVNQLPSAGISALFTFVYTCASDLKHRRINTRVQNIVQLPAHPVTCFHRCRIIHAITFI